MVSSCCHTVTSAPAAAARVSHLPNDRIASSRLLYGAKARYCRSYFPRDNGGPPILRRRFSVSAAQDRNMQQDQQLNLSVLRFTLGIPGLDESYLPRWIGVAFGSLILLNHFLSSSPAPAQLRSEVLGLCLAALSTTLPYFGKFLKGENPVERSTLPEGNQQIFIISENLLDSKKEDLAWASYVLLRNTNTMSVLIVVGDSSCVRGYWNVLESISKVQLLEWLTNKFIEAGFLDLKDTLYFPQKPDSRLQQILPRGTLSLLVQPIFGRSFASADAKTNNKGFFLMSSCASYAYNDNDTAWIRAISNKFQALSSNGWQSLLHRVVIKRLGMQHGRKETTGGKVRERHQLCQGGRRSGLTEVEEDNGLKEMFARVYSFTALQKIMD